MSTPMEQRFWPKVNRLSETGCWVWMAHRGHGGYGRFNVGGNVIRKAHRVSYELMVGPIPEGLQLDHLCRNRACVNPAHLEPVTGAQNARRGLVGVVQAIQHLSKTECSKGHPFVGENRMGVTSRRYCRTCRSQREREARARKRALAGGSR